MSNAHDAPTSPQHNEEQLDTSQAYDRYLANAYKDDPKGLREVQGLIQQAITAAYDSGKDIVRQATRTAVVEALEGLKAGLPKKFSPEDPETPGFSGGWHLDTYKLAIEDCRTDIDAVIRQLSTEAAE